MCVQRRLGSAWASVQFAQSFRCPHEESWDPYLSIERTANTLIRLGGCPGWPESSLGAQSFCWFCHEAAQMNQVMRKPVLCHMRTTTMQISLRIRLNLSKSEISRHKRAGLRVGWSDAQKADFVMTRLIFKSIRSRHDWISKDVSVKHNSNTLKWGHVLCSSTMFVYAAKKNWLWHVSICLMVILTFTQVLAYLSTPTV